MPKADNGKRRRAERHGRFGEWLAAAYLLAQFYRIRALRHKTPFGEIDLIAERFGKLVFVEVKMRANRAGEEDGLNAVNRRRIVNAARHYLSRHPALAARDMRFDVILLTPFFWLRHEKAAFDASAYL